MGYVFTGSVTKIGEVYHIYYTGHNPHLRRKGLPEEAVMHATSKDLFHWEKHPEDTFFAPNERYESNDWRDPFVFRMEDGKYGMLLAARSLQGGMRHRGETALCTSDDGVHWHVREPFWSPGLYYTHECPDYFKIGEWYYLVFSEFSQDKVTRYRMSRNPYGPWIAPKDDRSDGCAYYAAKTAGDDQDRYLFGWIATREGTTDAGDWQWGGCLVVHRLVQREDGTLGTEVPECVWNAFPKIGVDWAGALDGTGSVAQTQLGQLDPTCALELRFTVDGPNARVSIALFADEALNDGHFICLEFENGRLVEDCWPRPTHHRFQPGLERAMEIKKTNHLKVLIDGDAACAYLNGRISLCFRVYHKAGRTFGIIAENSSVSVEA